MLDGSDGDISSKLKGGDGDISEERDVARVLA